MPGSPSSAPPLTVAQQLAAVPPARFVAERTRLAAAMARAGDKAGAAAVRRLRKPGRSVWVLNQLTREAPAACVELFEASDALQEMQKSAGGNLASWRGSLAHQRSLFEALVEQARRLLRAADEPADEATLARVATGLRAAAAGGAAREKFAEGALSEDPLEPGFVTTDTPSLDLETARPREAVRSDERPMAAPKPGGAVASLAPEQPQKDDDSSLVKKLLAEVAEADRVAVRAAHDASEANHAWTLAQQAERVARTLTMEASEEVDRARRALAEAEAVAGARAKEHADQKRQVVERDAIRGTAEARASGAEKSRREAAAALEKARRLSG